MDGQVHLGVCSHFVTVRAFSCLENGVTTGASCCGVVRHVCPKVESEQRGGMIEAMTSDSGQHEMTKVRWQCRLVKVYRP